MIFLTWICQSLFQPIQVFSSCSEHAISKSHFMPLQPVLEDTRNSVPCSLFLLFTLFYVSLNFTLSHLFEGLKCSCHPYPFHWVHTAPIKLGKCDCEKGKWLPCTTWAGCFKDKTLVPVWHTDRVRALFLYLSPCRHSPTESLGYAFIRSTTEVCVYLQNSFKKINLFKPYFSNSNNINGSESFCL